MLVSQAVSPWRWSGFSDLKSNTLQNSGIVSTLLLLWKRAIGDVLATCTRPGTNFASSHNGLLFNFSVSAWSVIYDCAKLILRIACPVWFSLLLHLAWDWSLKDSFFFFSPSKCGRCLQEEVGIPLQNHLDAWFPCRGIHPWLFLPTWKVQRADRQLFSPSPAFPFSPLCNLWKYHFNTTALPASSSLSFDCSNLRGHPIS